MKSKGQGRSSFSLNGDWDITSSNDAELPFKFPSTIAVPSVVDCAQPRYEWTSSKYHWYRKRFTLSSEDGEYVFLRIGQSQFGTDVWVNGEHAGRYIGCYTSHEYDITGFLKHPGEENELIIRVGRKEDLPKESAVGNDHEKEVYTPGIWGDVALEVCRSPKIAAVQIIPDILKGAFLAKVTVQNLRKEEYSGTVVCELIEKHSRSTASQPAQEGFTVAGGASVELDIELKIDNPQLWSPEHPFLYELTSLVQAGTTLRDEVSTTCGLREFRIEGRRFLLNGKKIFLKGGNIAFHRFLADRERALLPWDPQWIQRALIDIPKEHNFNFFRNHLGQLYPAWYDIADEGGMLIQNEWQFWDVTGSEEQIKAEFTQWLKDNWNHPSIIIWDALNECSNDVVQKSVVPEMKRLDPTRPWESVDFVEDHPYIYSLGPVMNRERFGFTRGIPEFEDPRVPVMLNEFVWCWVNNAGEPTRLMEGVTERWLGRSATGTDLLEHQCFLASELVELFRRLRADAIQPFVYLSNNEGPTAHWFQGPIAELNPKPILKALKNAFSPVGVSIELWDRHFVAGERRKTRVFVINDEIKRATANLQWGIVNQQGEWLTREVRELQIAAGDASILDCEFRFPDVSGKYFVRAEVLSGGQIAVSEKIGYVLRPPKTPESLRGVKVAVAEGESENMNFLRSHGLACAPLSWEKIADADVVMLGEGVARRGDVGRNTKTLDAFLRRGGSIVVFEPEYGGADQAEVRLTESLKIRLSKREDRDKGGYDSYVFPEDPVHPVFASLSPEHFRMFNGGYGGEMVSQHDLEIPSPHTVLARCGMHLRVLALAEIVSGRGRVLISRIQTRGRLVKNSDGRDLYARRVDPVAQQYVLNLLSHAVSKPND